MNEPVIVKDAAGNILSSRHTDGTGWDYIYDESGNMLTCRYTNGTGYDFIYDENGRILTCTDIPRRA